jgi:glycosyltransferase involved in cell wall biosynthesis
LSERVAYFSICSLNYLHYARTLAQSLAAADPSAEFFLFVADRWDERTVPPPPGLRAIALDALRIPHLPDMAFRYGVLEFNTALKALCIEFLFRQQGYGRVIYLDPDIYVLKPLSHVTRALAEGAECVLTPHITQPIDDGRLPSEIDIMRAGVFNLGFCAFADSPEARAFIAWWRGKLATDCVVDLARGIFVDQTYCAMAPAFIARTTVLRHPGYNLAYWNLPYLPVTRTETGYCAAGEPLHFVHFSGIQLQDPDLVSRHQDRFRRADLGELRPVYDDYLRRLSANNAGPGGFYSNIPYGFGVTQSGLRIEPWMRRHYRKLHPAPAAGLDPFSLPADYWVAADQKERIAAAVPTDGHALTVLSQLVRSPRLLAKSIVRALYQGGERADDYWRRRVSARVTRHAAAAVATSPEPGAAIYGFFSAATGIGQAARDAALALKATGHPISCHDVGPRPIANAVPFDVEPGIGNRFDTALLWLNADNTTRLHDFVAAEALAGRRRIGQWVWELPVFPAMWARAFDQVDEVGTPTADVAWVVAPPTGKPVHIVPYAVEAPAPVDADAARAGLGVRDDEVLFACLFDPRSYVTRKNPHAVVRAFIDAFPDDRAGARLLVKWVAETSTQLHELEVLARSHRGITLMGRTLTRAEIWQIHAACDVHVSLHRAEGFGLNIAEAMAMGKLAIVTNFSGNTDFTAAGNALLVDFIMRRVQGHEYPCGEGQWWAEPSHEAAVEAMRMAHRDGALRRRLGERARQDIAALFSPAVVGRRMADLIRPPPQ